MADVMVFDLETENNPWYGAISSPRNPENYVVMNGWAIGNGPVQSMYYTQREDWLNIPESVGMLVAHNAPFEVDWMLETQPSEFMRFLARGGRVWCTAYAHYLLSNQQDTYPSLDEIAPKYGGTHKVDGIKVLWEQGYKTSQIDRTLLTEYLAGPGGDVENTRRVFAGQWAMLQERGMLNMALARMEGMLCNCFAMHAGLHVDRKCAFEQRDKIEGRLNELKAEFTALRSYMPQYVQFKESSAYHMSAWLFGGPIKYRVQDVWYEDDGVTPKQEKADFYKFGETLVRADAVADPAAFEAAVHEYGGIARAKAGKSAGQPRVFRENTGEAKLRWYDRVYDCPAAVPVGLLPADIQKSFKDEFTGKRRLADESPVYSTGSECLEMLEKRPELPEVVRALLRKLLEFAKLDKDAGTYYLREVQDEEGNVVKLSGMLQYLTDADIVNHVLNCTSTVTTRLSGTRPNMQNLPRGDEDKVYESLVKQMFSSRFDNPIWLKHAAERGYITQEVLYECMQQIEHGNRVGCIVEADYSALEVVTLAAFSRDKNLVQALLDNIDMHCMRLAQQLKEPYADVLLKCKDENHPEHATYKKMRTDIKPKAFAYQYGATEFGIAFNTGCTVEEARAFIDAEKALFPEVEAWYENTVFATVEKNTQLHREQTDTGWRVYKTGVLQMPGGTCYEFRQYPKTKWHNGQRVDLMEFKPTQMRNYPIQGESGFFVQVVAGQVMRWLVANNFFGGRVQVVNQVHDALYLDCCLSILPTVAAAVKAIMQALPTTMRDYGYELCVPFPVEVEYGPNMRDKTKFVQECTTSA